MSTLTISVEKFRLFAYHGVHEEERIIGAEFEVEADVEYRADKEITSLDQTLDYTRVVDIIRSEMGKPRALLETICQDIIAGISAEFPMVTGINITIRKINPPVANFRGQLAVNIRKIFT